MSPLLEFFGVCIDLACQDRGILPCHRPTTDAIFVSVPGRGYGVGKPVLFDRAAVNDPPRHLVFTMAAAKRAGLFDTDPLARTVPYLELCQRAQGVVADETAARREASELGGAVVRTPMGRLLWLDAMGRDAEADLAIVRDERRWADERVARRGEVSPCT